MCDSGDIKTINIQLAAKTEINYYTKGGKAYNEVKDGIGEGIDAKFSDEERCEYARDSLPGELGNHTVYQAK